MQCQHLGMLLPMLLVVVAVAGRGVPAAEWRASLSAPAGAVMRKEALQQVLW
jgi:hypothetical protein